MNRTTKRFSTKRSGLLHLLGTGLVASAVLCVSGCQDQDNSTGAGGVAAVLGSKIPEDHDRDGEGHSTKKEIVPPKVSPTGPWPKAVAAETQYRFGRMRLNGPDQKHDFTITNSGEAPLKLVAGRPTCQCTKFTLDQTEIDPGKFATLTIEWQGKRETASFSHGGDILTNDPENDTIHFFVTGIIESSIVTRPTSPWFAGNITGQTPAIFEASLFTRVIPDLTIESVSAKTDYTTTEYLPMTNVELKTHDALCGWNFKVTVSPEFPVGSFKDRLTVEYSDDKAEDTRIWLTANRFGEIRFSAFGGTRFDQKRLLVKLGQFPAAKGCKAELMLTVNQEEFGHELKLLQVESNPKSLQISLKAIGSLTGPTARYRMMIGLPPGGMKLQRRKGMEGTVHCRTNHPRQDEFTIAVTFNAF